MPDCPLTVKSSSPLVELTVSVDIVELDITEDTFCSLDADTAELRRMFVTASSRRQGIAKAMLAELEKQAARLGFRRMRLETGNRQASAMALYKQQGFRLIPPFGEYVGDPVSVCFEKILGSATNSADSVRGLESS